MKRIISIGLHPIEDYQIAIEYLVNGERTTIEKYREVADRYSIFAI